MAQVKDLVLSAEQQLAFEHLNSGENIFLTGGAGSGKSFLVRYFMRNLDPKIFPLLASTGAAAVLVGGRTFHSFFGLGIMEGGVHTTLNRALQNAKLIKRLNQIEGVVIDEISMIPAEALAVAEELCRVARNNTLPWGGVRVIVVGDFAQLPPVTKFGQKRNWSFQSEVWHRSGFQICYLQQNQRVQDNAFLNILSNVRYGKVTTEVRDFLDEHLREHEQEDKSTRLFPRRDQSELFNQKELNEIAKPAVDIHSIYLGENVYVENLKKNAPVPDLLTLKEGAKVMFLQNDMNKRWVNGTRGTVVDISSEKIIVEKENGRDVQVEKAQFSLLDADGNMKASVIQFPLTLAYATTIHKSQGATLESLWVDLTRLWEPGHAYVALSRLRSSQGLKLLGWSEKSFIMDPEVRRFYQSQLDKGVTYG